MPAVTSPEAQGKAQLSAVVTACCLPAMLRTSSNKHAVLCLQEQHPAGRASVAISCFEAIKLRFLQH